MAAILTVTGWGIFLPLLGVAVCIGMQLVRLVQEDMWNHAGVFAIGFWASLSGAACGAGMAWLPLVPAVLIALFTAAASAAVVWGEWRKRDDRTVVTVLRAAWRAARFAVRETLSRDTQHDSAAPAPAPPSGPRPVPDAAPPAGGSGPGPAPREVPPARMDPALDQSDPIPVLRGVTIPPDHAAAAARISGFEPDDDSEFGQFLRGEGSGFLGYSDAWRNFADTLGDAGIGLDPACVAAALEFAEVIGECAHDVTLIGRRYQAIYGATKEAVGDGLVLPFEARKFLTGEAL